MIGYIGSLLLGFCGLPELIRTLRDKYCHIGYGMLFSWLLGEILVMFHVLNSSKDKALLLNYTINIAILLVLVYYKIYGKRRID